jgi:hypothetical protein
MSTPAPSFSTPEVTVLQGVTDFVSGNSNCGQRFAVKLIRGQSDDLRLRIIVVSGFRRLNADVLQIVFVQQVASQLRAGSGISIGRNAVAIENPPHPETGSKNHDENEYDKDYKNHRRWSFSVCCTLRKGRYT